MSVCLKGDRLRYEKRNLLKCAENNLKIRHRPTPDCLEARGSKHSVQRNLVKPHPAPRFEVETKIESALVH
jgi:hypothetical protein